MVLEGHDLGHGSLISDGFICFLQPISMSRLPEVETNQLSLRHSVPLKLL